VGLCGLLVLGGVDAVGERFLVILCDVLDDSKFVFDGLNIGVISLHLKLSVGPFRYVC